MDTSCYVCHLDTDEHLLLVCDQCHHHICHTRCIGLESVPEDDWICHFCRGEMVVPEEIKENREGLLPQLFARAATPTELRSHSFPLPNSQDSNSWHIGSRSQNRNIDIDRRASRRRRRLHS